jgi:hypothetical protein
MDEYGRVAALRPANGAEQQLWVCPVAKSFQGVVSVCNQDSVDRKYSLARCGVAHGDVAANGGDWRAMNVVLPPGEPPHEISVNMAAGETIRVVADAADKVSFVVEGVLMS